MTYSPKGKKSIGYRWVYKIKYNSDGSIECYKTRSYQRIHTSRMVDCSETYTPVAKLVILRCLLAIAAARDWSLHQLDVQNACLHDYIAKKCTCFQHQDISDGGRFSVSTKGISLWIKPSILKLVFQIFYGYSKSWVKQSLDYSFLMEYVGYLLQQH